MIGSGPDQPLVDVRGLSIGLRRSSTVLPIVRGVDFSIGRGSTVALVGESGCGKSLTARALLRLVDAPLEITGGAVEFDGTDLLGLDERTMRGYRGARMGMVFQDPMTSLNPVLTIGRQLREMLEAHRGMSKRDAEARSIELLQSVHIANAATRLRQYPHNLSGGTLQRIMIAMALSCEPSVLVADEPTTALDVTVQDGILELLKARRDALGTSMLVISHDLGLVADIADEVAVMYAGRIVERAPVRQVFADPRHPYTRALLDASPHLTDKDAKVPTIEGRVAEALDPPSGCAFHTRCPFVMDRCRHEEPPMLGSSGVDSVACWLFTDASEAKTPRAAAVPTQRMPRTSRSLEEPAPAPLLQAVDLVKHYRVREGLFRRGREVVRAVDGVSFAIDAGRTLGLVGESGCGKTTTGRLVARLVEPTSGNVVFAGESLTNASQECLRQLRADVQIVFQDPLGSMDPRYDVERVVAEPLRAHGYGSNRDIAARVREVLDRVGIAQSYLNRRPRQLSGGQRQRVGIARALALDPRFVVCDEPLSALDVSIQGQIINLLEDLQAELGLAYLFISHDLGVVHHMSDHVAVMYLGRIVEHGPAEALYARPAHPYTRTLLDAVPMPDPEHQSARQATRVRADLLLPGEASSGGCAFRPRCPSAVDLCREEAPSLRLLDNGRLVACHVAQAAGPVPVAIRPTSTTVGG